MNFDPNDPRITAHALGEPLDAEAEAFIREHEADPAFQEAVEEIQQTAALLATAFAAEPETVETVDEESVLANVSQPAKPPSRFKLFVFSSPRIAASLVLFLGLAGALGWWLVQPEKFTATATVQVLRPEFEGENVLVCGNDFQVKVGIAESNALAQAAAERLSTADRDLLLKGHPQMDSWVESATAEIMRITTVEPDRKAYQFDINVQHPDEQLAAKVANYLADEYINYNVKRNIEISMRTVELLRTSTEQQRQKVEEIREEINEYRKSFKRLGFAPDGYDAKKAQLAQAEATYAELKRKSQTEMAQVALVSADARIVSKATAGEETIMVAEYAAPPPAPESVGAKDRDALIQESLKPANRPKARIAVTNVSQINLSDQDVNMPVVDSRVSGYAGVAAVSNEKQRVAINGLNSIAVDRYWSDSPDSSVDFSNSSVDFFGVKRESQRLPQEPFNREGYDLIKDNEFVTPQVEPLSTFSIDVDTASYANVRRMLRGGQLPPLDVVRIEELINYFDYDYSVPETGEHPFSVNTEVAPVPWAQEHYLVRIGLKGYEVPWNERPASNLVFLVDVSGSMSSANKLGLVKQALTELSLRLDRRDRVAIVVYAGSSGLALPSTTADNQETIQHALEQLKSGGSTNGGQGIELAYQVAQKHFTEGGNNRVILCTDGDFNVGVSDRGQLTRLIEDKAKSGVYLSVCGFGMGNLKDDMMESLSNSGNGNYAYIDNMREARKVFGQDLSGTMLTIAKDVKIQVEFNPANVAAYRLIGYENRMLAAKDFNDDQKDAGEIGAGHTVTALYEIVPVGADSAALPQDSVDPLKYQQTEGNSATQSNSASKSEFSDEWVTVKLRYKQPDGDTSTLMSTVVNGPSEDTAPSADFQFATAVAEFGLLLRKSEYAGEASWPAVIERARDALGANQGGHRSEFVELARKAQALSSPLPESD
ncbi:YfbK domain-containing protein [Cerasicoccus maritimus]|uniref:YfbK domain-containing protein n=1 Tax=Cerasicoccus maritimus TaxID=490089 RepID=UPI0028528659|nr:von Willebrand factor type A domain-containing protein [Cerasicoccus maritimus]